MQSQSGTSFPLFPHGSINDYHISFQADRALILLSCFLPPQRASVLTQEISNQLLYKPFRLKNTKHREHGFSISTFLKIMMSNAKILFFVDIDVIILCIGIVSNKYLTNCSLQKNW